MEAGFAVGGFLVDGRFISLEDYDRHACTEDEAWAIDRVMRLETMQLAELEGRYA